MAYETGRTTTILDKPKHLRDIVWDTEPETKIIWEDECEWQNNESYVSDFLERVRCYETNPRADVKYPNIENLFKAYFDNNEINIFEDPRGTKETAEKLKKQGKWMQKVNGDIYENIEECEKLPYVINHMYSKAEEKGILKMWGRNNGFWKGKNLNSECYHAKFYICYDGSQGKEFFEKFVEFMEHNNVEINSKTWDSEALEPQKLIIYSNPKDFNKVADFLIDNKDMIHPVEMNLPWGIQLIPGVSIFPEGPPGSGMTPTSYFDDVVRYTKSFEETMDYVVRTKEEREDDPMPEFMYRLLTDKEIKRKMIADYPWDGPYKGNKQIHPKRPQTTNCSDNTPWSTMYYDVEKGKWITE